MGQKVNPHGMRVGVIKDWDAKWFADDKNFSDKLFEDHKIRKYMKKELYDAGISRMVFERSGNKLKIKVHAAKPGMVIGKGGTNVEKTRKEVQKMTDSKVILDVVEVKTPSKDAQLVSENIALQLENRISFRRAMKQAMRDAMKVRGVEGFKVSCAGRLGGAEMARTEDFSVGSIPLQTLRADIDYGFAEASTSYGKIGVKVWIYNGEILPTKNEEGAR